MLDETELHEAFDLDDHWEARFVGPVDRAQEVAQQYHQRDVPTRLAPLPAEEDVPTVGASRTVADGGTGSAYVLFVDSLCARPTASDGPHTGLTMEADDE